MRQGPGGPGGYVRGQCLLWAPWATHMGPWSPRKPAQPEGSGNLPGGGKRFQSVSMGSWLCWRGLDCTPHNPPVPEMPPHLMTGPPCSRGRLPTPWPHAAPQCASELVSGRWPVLLRGDPNVEPVGRGVELGDMGSGVQPGWCGLPYTHRLPPPTWQVPTDHFSWWPRTPRDPQPPKH